MSARLLAIDSLYLGGQVGHVGVTGVLKQPYGNTIGFEGDLGIRNNPIVDVNFNYHYSSHDSNLKIQHAVITADLNLGELNDFEFLFGVGPGFYFFKTVDTETKFGLQFNSGANLVVDEVIRLGLGLKWNNVFDAGVGDSYFTFMFRAGYIFEF